MEHLSGRKQRTKSSAYATMIRQLLQEVQKLTQENEQLRKELASASQTTAQTTQKITTLTMERDTASINLQKEREKVAAERIALAMDLANKEGEMNRLHQQNLSLIEQVAALKKEKNALKETQHTELTTFKKEMGVMRARLEQSEEEKRALHKQLHEKEALHQQEVEELRKINSIIKKNFQIMEEDYDSLLKLAADTTHQHQPHRTTKRKSVAHIKPKQVSRSNPQMQEEIFRIKQQVCDQMERLSCSREQAVKGRVDRTLATIQSLLGEMSHRADLSDDDLSA